MHRHNGKFLRARMPDPIGVDACLRTHLTWYSLKPLRFRVTESDPVPPRLRFTNKLKWYNNAGRITSIHRHMIPESAEYRPREEMRMRLWERCHLSPLKRTV